MDLGVLVALPLESIVVRAVVATLGVVVCVRLLLRYGIMRSPHARIATAMAPAIALVVVVLLTGTSLRPPMVMFPAEGARAIPIPVRDGSLNFAPIAVPLLVGVWASVAGFRLFRRTASLLRVRQGTAAMAGRGAADVRVRRVASRVAGALNVAEPRIVVRPRCPGGAFVVGSRRPVIVIGADLLAKLDAEELEGVIAHELAHVRRRDTLVATALGVLRDLTFFVPGGGWAIEQLHRERELAADRVAVKVTKRPGALASGLLKVLDTGAAGRTHACASLVPSSDLVDRVRVLVDDAPAPTRLRRTSETVVVAVVVLGATAAAVVLPSAIAGPQQQRDALAFVWSSTPAVTAEVPTGEARIFDVYRRGANFSTDPAAVRTGLRIDERTQEYRRAALHACVAGECPIPERTLSLRLQPAVRAVDDARSARWNATQVGRADTEDGFRLFWLARFE